MKHKTPSILFLLLLLPLAGVTAEVTQDQDPESGLERWQWQQDGLQLQQIQRLPDQTRAFYLGRGFSREEAERIAANCVFQTLFRNQGTQAVEVNLEDWQVITQGEARTPRLARHWQQEWEQRNSAQSARVAFNWSLFPDRQRFLPGDWNMGMLLYPAPHGSTIDLKIVWHEDGKRHEALLPALRCSQDEAPAATGEQP